MSARCMNGGQPLDRLPERDVLVGERGERRREVGDEAREIGLPRREVRYQVARGRDGPRELAVSRLSSRNRTLAVEIAGLRYSHASCASLRSARVLGRRALEHVLNALAGRRVQRVEELVEIDRARGGGPRRIPPEGSRAPWPAQGRAGRSDSRFPTARRPDDRRRALAQRLELRVVDVQRQLSVAVWGQRDLRDRYRSGSRRPRPGRR